MAEERLTATQSLATARKGNDGFNYTSSAFVCPYPDCGAFALHDWGQLKHVDLRIRNTVYSRPELASAEVHIALCHSCAKEVIFIDGKLAKPLASEAPPPTADMPTEILPEYQEAAAILPNSPRGSAALLRLAVQKLLPLIGSTKADINAGIADLVKGGVISARVQQALDSLRVIGNEAVHPGTLDLKDDVDTAMSLFRLLNFIVEKAISDPKHADEIFAKLPESKRDAIARRDGTGTP